MSLTSFAEENYALAERIVRGGRSVALQEANRIHSKATWDGRQNQRDRAVQKTADELQTVAARLMKEGRGATYIATIPAKRRGERTVKMVMGCSLNDPSLTGYIPLIEMVD